MNDSRRQLHVRPIVVAVVAALCIDLAATACAGTPTAQRTAATTDSHSANGGQTVSTAALPSANGARKAARAKKKSSAALSEQQTLAAINVTGIAGSQLRDIVLKRYSPQISDSITAENIGQLPDVTISDSLSRVPGIQIGRSGGEGTTVSINGLPQVQTTLNGEQFVSPGGSNGVLTKGAPDLDSGVPDFEAIPATMFSGVDVLKSIMASDISGGVSGIINLKTYRPFDFSPGWSANGSLQGGYGSRTQKLQPKGSFLVNWRNNKWGVTLDASYNDEDIFNSQSNISQWDTGYKTTEADVGFLFPGRTGPLGNSLAETYPLDYYYNWDPRNIGTSFSTRKRTGLDGSFEYKFNDSLTLIADAMYTRLNELDSAYSIMTFDNYVPGRLQPGPVTPIISPQGALIRGITDDAELATKTEVGNGFSKSLNTNLELDYNGPGIFSGDLRWVHGSADRNYNYVGDNLSANQGFLITRPDGTQEYNNPGGYPDSIPILQDYTGPFPSLYVYPNVTNPASWTLASVYASRNHIDSGLNVYRGDGTIHLDTGVLDSIQFGARYGVQTFSYMNSYYTTPIFPEGSCSDPTGPGPNDNVARYIDARLVNSCTGFNDFYVPALTSLPPGYLTSFDDFSPVSVRGTGITSSTGFPVINAAVMTNPVQFIRALVPPGTGPTVLMMDPTNSYVVDLHELSAYTQFNFSGNVFGMQWSGNAGIRRQRSDYYIYSYKTNSSLYVGNGGEYNGVNIPLGVEESSQSSPFWLPSINFTLDTTSDQQFRFAYNKTQARQDLSAMGQGFQTFVELNGNPPHDPSLPSTAELFQHASSGNPQLKPYQSSNYNLSYAWYFNPHSILYVGAFFMDVANFPQAAVLTVSEPDADGVVRRTGQLFTTINGGGSDIRGFEGEFRTQFTRLPGLLSGLGVNLNYTYLHSSNPLAAGASNLYNAIAFYEKGKWQARVAYSWSGKVPGTTVNVEGDNLEIYQRAAGWLDASLLYKVNKNLTIFLEGLDLNNQYTSSYIGNPDAYWATNVPERRYFAGARVHF